MTTNNKEVYQLKIKSTYKVPDMKVSEIAFNRANRYLAQKAFIEPKKLNLYKAGAISALKRTVVKKYKIEVLKSILDNQIFEDKIPSSSINNFSIQCFGEKIDTHAIVALSNDKIYSKYFIDHVGRYGNYDVNFVISEEDIKKMRLIANELKEEAEKMFMQFIGKEQVTRAKKKI